MKPLERNGVRIGLPKDAFKTPPNNLKDRLVLERAVWGNDEDLDDSGHDWPRRPRKCGFVQSSGLNGWAEDRWSSSANQKDNEEEEEELEEDEDDDVDDNDYEGTI